MTGLSAIERKVWEAASELQRGRPRGAPAPSYAEVGAVAGLSRTTVGNVLRLLELRGLVQNFGQRRGLYVVKLAPKPKAKKDI
jgi:DNA-binding GntR family transcriptional regulator